MAEETIKTLTAPGPGSCPGPDAPSPAFLQALPHRAG